MPGEGGRRAGPVDFCVALLRVSVCLVRLICVRLTAGANLRCVTGSLTLVLFSLLPLTPTSSSLAPDP